MIKLINRILLKNKKDFTKELLEIPEDSVQTDQAITKLYNVIEELTKVIDNQSDTHKQLVDRIIKANSITQLQGMFIEKEGLRERFNLWIKEYGYSFKKQEESDKDSDIITT